MLSPQRVSGDHKPAWGEELKRWVFLAGVAIWIFHPFATSRMIGTGDALWYGNMLADFVLQWRTGVFPIFVGQTEYAFNGAVYPLRVAPLFQHVGGVLDLLTARQLSFFALQHLVVISTGVAGIVSCYLCLTAVAPQQRWAAALLSTLYITSPGVLGVIFIQDLYMSWMTLPFLPLVGYGIVRSYKRDDNMAWLAIAFGLGGAWLAHAPIAMWMTAIAGGAQSIRLLFVHRTVESWKRALGGAGMLLALAQYPFVSNYLLQASGAPSASGGPLEQPEKIVSALQAAFPECLLPLSTGAGNLSDLQLGYGLMAVLIVGLAASFVKSHWPQGVLLAATGAVILILWPIPFWSELFWLKLTPDAIRRLTFYWPMHRLYLVLATLTVFVGILAVETLVVSRQNLTRVLVGILTLGCSWSLWESRQFQTAATLRTASREDTERKQRSENRLLMNHAYGLFAKLPPYYSNGVMDPSAEFRLLDLETQEALPAIPEIGRRLVVEGAFIGSLDANPGILNLAPTLTLSPGKHYDLEFDFESLNYSGILQLVGTSLFREYVLPSSGEPRAFGTLPPNSSTLPLWTTQADSEIISLRFIPTGPELAPLDFVHFAQFRLFERSQSASSIQVITWIPLTLEVTAPTAALLETPRMFTPGYQAFVDSKPVPVQPSTEVLVGLPIPIGKSEVTLSFVAPRLLHLSYWTMLGAWVSLLVTLPFIRRLNQKRPG